jgi:hypothetical protein
MCSQETPLPPWVPLHVSEFVKKMRAEENH